MVISNPHVKRARSTASLPSRPPNWPSHDLKRWLTQKNTDVFSQYVYRRYIMTYIMCLSRTSTCFQMSLEVNLVILRVNWGFESHKHCDSGQNMVTMSTVVVLRACQHQWRCQQQGLFSNHFRHWSRTAWELYHVIPRKESY